MLQPIPEEEGYEDKIAREEEMTINNKPKVQPEGITTNEEENEKLEENKTKGNEIEEQLCDSNTIKKILITKK